MDTVLIQTPWPEQIIQALLIAKQQLANLLLRETSQYMYLQERHFVTQYMYLFPVIINIIIIEE